MKDHELMLLQGLSGPVEFLVCVAVFIVVLLVLFRIAHWKLAKQRWPDKQAIEQGQYGSDIDLSPEDTGQVVAPVDDGTGVLWQFQPAPLDPKPAIKTDFEIPDLVFSTLEGREEFRVSRRARIPLTFVVLQNGEPVAEIVRRSILRNKYSIQCDGRRWIVRMPLFTMRFFGVSDQGQCVWILVASNRRWSMLFERGSESPRLVVSIAFIHRLWWRYS